MSGKKIVIKPFRPNVSMNKEQAQKIWEALAHAIQEIHNQNSSKLSFEELYRNAYSLVLHKHGELLYEGLRNTVTRHLSRQVEECIVHTSDEELVQVIGNQWQDHKVVMLMIRDILMYLDRTYVSQTRRVPVYDLSLKIFYTTVVCHVQVADRLGPLVLGEIDRERRGEVIDRSLMKTILSMLLDLGLSTNRVYEDEFEHEFLIRTAEFYRHESQSYLGQTNCPDYLRKIEHRLNEEQQRVCHYLVRSTEVKLKAVLERELIQQHAFALVDMEGSGCNHLFKHNQVDDLTRMYRLFQRVSSSTTPSSSSTSTCPIMNGIRKAMYEFIRDEGKKLMQSQAEMNEKGAVHFVQGLLDLRQKFDNFCKHAFENNNVFQKTLKDGFESFINLNTTCAAYLAQYVDDMMRGSAVRSKSLSEEEFDHGLDQVILLFRYIQDKDIFEEYYKRHLSKRLLTSRSISDEAEKSMIAKLKAECGYQFTSKLEGMIKDMKTSKDTMDIFKQEMNKQPRSSTTTMNIETHVHVLTAGYWPVQESKGGKNPVCLPECIIPCCDTFQQFYLGKHSGRRLSWQTDMGTADLKVSFRSTKVNELNVSTYQMCILMLFNSNDCLSFTDILAQTKIPEQDARRHLISLCTPKYRILLKSSKGKNIDAADMFSFNAEFKSKLYRVRIPLVSQKETKSTTDAVPEPVAEDRKHLIEAAIVRIMKTRKTMQHNNLVAEVSRLLSTRFAPSLTLIKRRIESLIEREYLERSQTDRRLYNYLA